MKPEKQRKVNARKEALLTAARFGIDEMLRSMSGADLFGANTEMYPSVSGLNSCTIKTSDGEFYFLKIQKSAWEEEPK